MAFKINLAFNGSLEQGSWVLEPGRVISILTKTGPVQATMLPDPESKSDVDSYTLTLVENGPVPHLKPATENDYEFRLEHKDTDGKIDADALVNGPHTLSLLATGRTLTVSLKLEQPIGEKKHRAHLSLTDRQGQARETSA